jgi:DHA2 family multidrug resistance protein
VSSIALPRTAGGSARPLAPAAKAAPRTAEPARAARAPVKINKWAIAVAVSLGALLEVIDTSIVNVALSDIQASLGATLSQVSWVVSSYAVANVIILPLTAWLGDRFGKKRYFIFSLAGFTVASALCGFATNLPMLIVARVLQGLCGGGLMAKAQSILFETFPREEQPMAQGLFGGIVIAGPAIGPTLGGYLTTNVDWRWIFYVNLPVGIGAMVMCAIYLVPDVRKTEQPGDVDWLAIALLAVGLGSLQTVLEEGQTDDWFQSSFITIFAALAAVGTLLFVWRTLRSKAPVVDLRVLRYRSLWAGSLMSVVLGMGLYGALFAVPIFAQSMLNFTSQQTGLLLLPGALASAIAMPLTAKLMGRVPDARVLITAGALILVGALLQLDGMNPATGADALFWPLIVRSFGTVLMFLPLNLATLGAIPRKDVSAAAGFFNLTRQLGGSIGVALLTTVLAQRQAFHRNVIVEKLAYADPKTLERVATFTSAFVAKGYDRATAHLKALRLLDGGVDAQAAVMSFGDTFWLTAAMFLVTLPLVFLLGKGGGKVQMGH